MSLVSPVAVCERMKHLEPFEAREVTPLPVAARNGWRLKRYAIVADGRVMDEAVIAGATASVFDLLPAAGELENGSGNHGIGFQIVHFAEEIAAVSPIFYWQWGSVLASTPQMRSDWAAPAHFGPGHAEVVGCIWEMQVVHFETDLWTRTILGSKDAPEVRLEAYLNGYFSLGADPA